MKRPVISNREDHISRVWLTLPGEWRKRGQELMHQQCWCWGADIRRSHGDWLQQQGFAKTRPPLGKRGSNSYHCSDASHGTITLWGFGMCFGQVGLSQAGLESIFLSRYSFFPRLRVGDLQLDSIWKAEHTTDLFEAPKSEIQCHQALNLLESALLWMASYERHVLSSLGTGYRETTLGQWSHVVQRPEAVPGAWEELALEIRGKARGWHRDAQGLRELPLFA